MTAENTQDGVRRVPSRRELRARREVAERIRREQASAQHTEQEPIPGTREPQESAPTPVQSLIHHESEAPQPSSDAPNQPVAGPHTTRPSRRSAQHSYTPAEATFTPVPVEQESTDISVVPDDQPRMFSDAQPEPVSPQRAPHKKRSGLVTAFIVVLIGVVIAGGVFLAKNLLATGPGGSGPADYTGVGSGSVTVEVPQGASGTAIANALAEKDVVASTQAFVNALAINPDGAAIQPGTYELRQRMSGSAALAALLDEANRLDVRITIPEGFRVTQLEARLVNLGGYSKEEVTAALANSAAIGLPEQANGNPEGWIAPGTYQQAPNEPVTELLKRMINRNVERLKNIGVPPEKWQEVLTKASILEREVSIKKDMPKVARVIDNRLDPERGKEVLNKLQMDSTVSYAVGRSTGIPSADELQTDSPYNTYRNAGLPPGPIAFAGDEAVRAVMSPAEGNWLYFVTVNLDTGETVFADTYEQFQAAKAQLKQFCAEHSGSC